MRVFAIDPGTIESGYVIFENGKIIDSGVEVNEILRDSLKIRDYDVLALEMVACYGMPVGKEVFETCLWIGRFIECSKRKHKLIERRDVKLHLCGNVRAKDGNIRQAIIDKLGPKGTKKEPGPTYGISSHAWQALALALTATNQ